MRILAQISDINQQQWDALVETLPTATWFQTREAYDFYASLPHIFTPFVFACENNGVLKGIVVGYITREKCAIKQFFTRRAIIIGGPLLSNDITQEELHALLKALMGIQGTIYLETRNFHDYSPWRETFEESGFTYQPHLNYHINTTSMEIMEKNLYKSRKREIRRSLEAGAEIITNPTIEQVRAYYVILRELYRTKVKTPLFPLSFFEKLYTLSSAYFLLVAQGDTIIGGTVCVGLQEKALYEWFACGTTHDTIYPSTLATYAGIRYAAEHHFPCFDMMGAGKPQEDYGVRDFKSQFGGELVEYGRFIHIRNSLLYKIGTLGVKILKKI